MLDITASIVTYCNNPLILKKAVDSFLQTKLNVKLYISDNSPTDSLRGLFDDKRIEYIFNNANIGFGKAHNICIKLAEGDSYYHLILNPDVYFEAGILEELKEYMDKNPDVGLVSPKVLYPDGSIQYSCRLLPKPTDFVIRRVSLLSKIFSKRVKNQELQHTGYDKLMEVPFILGCFMLIRNHVFSEVGMFDDRYFMYLEDLDLSRRIHAKYRTVFYPFVSIYHIYGKESSKRALLLKVHVESLIKYYNKWGWFSFNKTDEINRDVLSKVR